MKKKIRTCLVAVISCAHIGLAAGLVVTALKTEYKVDPLGIDVATPRLSWVLSSADRAQIQTAYRVIVAASEKGISTSTGDVWDSQRTDSSRSVGVAYKGPALQSKKRYWWKVMAWDKNGQSSGWSDAAWFETGLLNSSEWTGQWIGGDGSGNEAPYLRKEFTVEAGKTVAAARLSMEQLRCLGA